MLSATLLVAMLGIQDAAFDPGPNSMLMRQPTLSKDAIVFTLAGDLWSVPREGGSAVRLTSAPGNESFPRFSPDGSTIAFSGQLEGNTDVFVIPAKGGVPKRLTAHPSPDEVMGWTPDGKSVLFSSNMTSDTDYARMYSVPVTGGFPKELPFPAGVQASMSPDSSQIAYVPNTQWQDAWKRYRGGQTTPIWITNMSDSKWKSIPRKNTNDKDPMWVGDSIYYLSDPEGIFGMYRYDTKSGRITTEVKPSGFDLKSASAGPGAIVYERLGAIHLYDLQSKQSKKVAIDIQADFPELRPQFKDLSRRVSGASISPTGQRVVLAARGYIFTVPATKGDARLLTEKQGVHRRSPAWSPDGKTIAFFTDQNGAQELGLIDLSNNAERIVKLAESPAYYYRMAWSPDSKKIAYTDNKNNLWVLDVQSGVSTKADSLTYRGPTSFNPQWSPDSKWITYAKDLDSHFDAIFLYNVEANKPTQITDGLADAESPVFDRDGKHLYFTASTDVGNGIDTQNISAYNNLNSTSSVYCVVLRKDGPNPLHPESDEEPIKDSATPPAKPDGGEKLTAAAETKIDLEGIEERIITLPFPRQIYSGLQAGPAGSLFALSGSPQATVIDSGGPGTLHKFTFASRKVSTFASGVSSFQVSADGNKMLLNAGGQSIVSTQTPPTPGQGVISLANLRVRMDPMTEWKAIFEETVRNQKMLFYAPNMHGIDMDKMAARYRPFLANLKSRADLNYLLTDMLGELCVGHMFIGGGDIPGAGQGVGVGLLGADYTFENGRYRLARIYNGERWNPGLSGPLAQPGIMAKVGEYVLAIDGKDLTTSTDIYEALENKAGKQVKVRLGPTPDGKDSREVTVVPVASESSLRSIAWVENNRRRVAEATQGRAGYVHVPDTNVGGWVSFTRYFYAQTGKDAFIVDERFNGGGAINDFMVRELNKPLDFFSATRYGKNWMIPSSGVYGPKVMITNEMAGSGGDIFPYLFRQQKTGKIVGRRTWGAMITNYSFSVVDGGRISSPDDAMFNVNTGKWIIENEGTPPDIEVELDPFLWRQGKDAQLEKAIEVILEELKSYKPKRPVTPAYPDWSKLP